METVNRLVDEIVSVVPVLPESFSFCALQIAGHHYSKKKEERLGVLSNSLNGHIFKPLQNPPRGKREKDFYEYVWNSCHDTDNYFTESYHKNVEEISDVVKELKRFIPQYFGVTDIIVDGRSASFLELENINGRFKKPCVVDIKIGAKTWDPLATKEKIETDIKKYPWAPLLGFRFLGMKNYKPNGDRYESLDSNWGKTIADTQVVEALNLFFQREFLHSKAIASCILRKLYEILNFFERQKCFQFYSSSILISYEGLLLNQNIYPIDDLFDQSVQKLDSLVDVRMIDFTHVFNEINVFDENYIHGLRTFIIYLENFITTC